LRGQREARRGAGLGVHALESKQFGRPAARGGRQLSGGFDQPRPFHAAPEILLVQAETRDGLGPRLKLGQGEDARGQIEQDRAVFQLAA